MPNVKKCNIDDDRAKATIVTHQAGNYYGWREDCPQPPDVLFNGVGRLNSTSAAKVASRRVIERKSLNEKAISHAEIWQTIWSYSAMARLSSARGY